MTTITREQQKQILIDTANHVISRDNTSPYSENLRELARIALASLEAEPIGAFHIADQQVGGTSDYIKDGEWPIDNGVIEVYAAPPVPVQVDIEMLASALKNAPLAPSDNQGRPRAPVVPPAIEPDYKVIKSILPTANPDEYACCIAADMWNACRAAMLQGAEAESNHDELALYYLQGQKDGLEWAAQLAEANHPLTGDWLYDDPLELAKAIRKGPDMPGFAGSSPVTPDGWISCSERMPAQDDWVLIYSKYGEYLAGQVQGKYVELNDGTLSWLGAALHWMPLPAAPQQEMQCE